MSPTEKHTDVDHFLFDKDLLPDIDADCFDVAALEKAGRLHGTAMGRGTTQFVELNGLECVLRHYRRGGMVANILGDRYWRCELARSRAWREWHLLAELVRRGLPAPAPVAARVVEHGYFYTADLITRHLLNTRPLSQVLQDTALSAEQWRAVGHCIQQFHAEGVYHADLNAHNIMLGMNGKTVNNEVYLIDFDKGELRNPNVSWQLSNLSRLQRSLQKLQEQEETFYFAENDWGQLVSGWRGESPAD